MEWIQYDAIKYPLQFRNVNEDEMRVLYTIKNCTASIPLNTEIEEYSITGIRIGFTQYGKVR